jgi:pimeloyl-ACP methyl ester carboxylesterase
MPARWLRLLVLPTLLVGLGGCPRFQEGPVSFWGTRGFVKVGNEQIYVKDVGQGPALLLIHGYGSSHDSFLMIIPELARTHRVLAVDLPGFGRSDKYPGDYSPAALARRLFKLLDQKGIAQADLAAHSWGSSIAFTMALEQPRRVRTLTLMGAWVYEDQHPPFIVWARAPVIGEILYTLFYKERLDDRMALAFYNPEPFIEPEGTDMLRRQLNRPGAVAAALAAARGQYFGELQKHYREVQQPVLLIWGAQDRVSRLAYGQRLKNELRDAKLVVIPQCGHIPMFERPRPVLQAMREFLPPAAAPAAPAPTTAPAPAPAAPTKAKPAAGWESNPWSKEHP